MGTSIGVVCQYMPCKNHLYAHFKSLEVSPFPVVATKLTKNYKAHQPKCDCTSSAAKACADLN